MSLDWGVASFRCGRFLPVALVSGAFIGYCVVCVSTARSCLNFPLPGIQFISSWPSSQHPHHRGKSDTRVSSQRPEIHFDTCREFRVTATVLRSYCAGSSGVLWWFGCIRIITAHIG